MAPIASQFRLPNFMTTWPWKEKRMNPYYEEVKAESEAWFSSFEPFSPKALKAFFGTGPCLLSAYCYPDFTREQFRAACDFMSVLFMLDEYTDVEDEAGAIKLHNIAMDAVRNPYRSRPAGESIVGEVCRQYSLKALELNTPVTHRRFIQVFDEYTHAVAIEARDRQTDERRALENYMDLRRRTSALRTVYALIQYGLDIPDHVYNHETVQRLQDGAVDMDVWSYNVEQHHGNAGHNLITVIMDELDLSFQETLAWLEEYEQQTAAQFASNINNVPSWGPGVDAQVAELIHGLGTWVRANEYWSFQCTRYFGSEGPKIFDSRIVTLLPKREEAGVVSLAHT
ncbi:terpenoid synthase [Sistotremastrum niveocremeum HHB9708]|uniref:Terpene synthase n=1 Tax=Sistotremastrum niveocremeum HHB9708 TaxID=1314777 RepID=A0A164Z0H7_9AGAM|nr:terpenoid synthase [Sistotremastrum niveocremeum HHB9708]